MTQRGRPPGAARGCAAHLCALAVAVGSVPDARANGRFPSAGQVAFHPTDPNHWVVRATFGLLQTRDAGKSWGWVCERVLDTTGNEDPFVLVTASSALLLATAAGLRRSVDGACSWNQPAGAATAELHVDLAAHPANAHAAVALYRTGTQTDAPYAVAATLDDGASWQPFGVPMPAGFLALALEAAAPAGPGLPLRLVASGRTGPGHQQLGLLRTDDNGKTWSPRIVPRADGLGAYVSAVAASSAPGPLRIFVRVDGEPGDTLLVSDDDGATWMTALDVGGAMTGFARSPDGKTTLVGVAGEGPGGVYRAGPDLQFAKVAALQALCLGWGPAGLFACGSELTTPFTLGRSTDAGATWTPRLQRAHVEPQACPDATPAGLLCPPYWLRLAPRLGSPEKSAPPSKPATPNTTCRTSRGAAGMGWLLALAGCVGAWACQRGLARRRAVVLRRG